MRKYEKDDEVRHYRSGDTKGVVKKIAKVIPQKPILPEYVAEPAVFIFTDGTWAFSWNCWPK